MWVQGAKLRASVRAIHALNHRVVSPAGSQLLNSHSLCSRLSQNPNPENMGRCCSQNISLPSPHLGRIAIFLSEAALFLLSASKPNVNVTSSTVFSLRPQASHRGQSSLLGQERRLLPPGTPFQTRATKGLARRGQYTTKERSLKGQGH